MSVGILLITHRQIGQAIYDTVVTMMGCAPLNTRILEIGTDSDPDKQKIQAQKYINELEQGDGVLILTDLFGSTPSNISCALRSAQVTVVSGLNLPMLVRVMNYPTLDLGQLQLKAVSGGKEGVFTCQPEEPVRAATKH